MDLIDINNTQLEVKQIAGKATAQKPGVAGALGRRNDCAAVRQPLARNGLHRHGTACAG